MKKHLVFVYGTLKRGYYNNRLLEGQEFVGEAITEPKYRLYDLGSFPGLVEDNEKGKAIKGEVWRVDEKVIPRLDMLEGTPHLYRREFIDIAGMDEKVQGYIFNRSLDGCDECSPVWEGSKW